MILSLVLACLLLTGCRFGGTEPQIVKVETWPDKAYLVNFASNVGGAYLVCEIPGRKTFSDGHVEDYGLRYFVKPQMDCR